jgi:hypothetical protein
MTILICFCQSIKTIKSKFVSNDERIHDIQTLHFLMSRLVAFPLPRAGQSIKIRQLSRPRSRSLPNTTVAPHLQGPCFSTDCGPFVLLLIMVPTSVRYPVGFGPDPDPTSKDRQDPS